MKKLMTVLASAATALCAVGAWADFTETSTDFESSTAGQAFDSNNGMDGHWVAGSDAELFISNHTDTISVSRPDYVGRDNENNGNYLAIENSVTRGLNEMSGTDFPGVAIPDNGIYLDTLVKFTAADEVFGNDALAAGVDKIAIEYVAQGDDVENPITNFVIRAGYIGAQEISAVNYMADVPENFDVSAWHRLTVRTFASIDAANHVGFVVYLDEVPLAYSTSDVCGDNFEATGLAADYYTNELHALYPSAVDSQATGGSAITSATFSGTGCIDDVVFTTNKPGFITVDPDVTVTWDASVATLTLNGAAVEGFVAGTGGSAKITPVEGVVTVAATFAAGWEYGACETDGAGAWDASTKQFTGLAAGETCNIVGMKPLFDVGGVHYASIEDEALLAALAAGTEGTPATLTLLDNVDTPIEVTEGYIILDLAGKTITDAEDGEGLTAGYAISNAGANLTIINSTETIGHVVASEGGAAVTLTDDGLTTITAGIFDGVFDGQGVGNLVITGGTFYDEEYDGDAVTDFYLAGYVSGATPAYIGEHYFQVGGGVPPAPTTYTLTVTDNANATTSITINEQSAETGAEIEDDDVIVITATPNSGYEYASAPEGWALSEGVITKTITVDGADVAVTIPAPTPTTYTVTVTPDQNATYAAAYKVGGETITPVNDVLTVTVGQTIVITATPAANYEYAETPTGWTAGQAGEITIEVSVAAEITIPAPMAKQQGGYPSYIDPTDTTAKAKYDAWKDTYGADTGSAYEEAFLLNCAPDEVATEEAAFKFTAIYQDSEGNWVAEMPEKNTKGSDYNGTVTIKRYSDVGCTVESESGNFFKAILD